MSFMYYLANIYVLLSSLLIFWSYKRQCVDPRVTGKNCARYKRVRMHFLLKNEKGLLMRVHTKLLYSVSKIKNQLKQYN